MSPSLSLDVSVIKEDVRFSSFSMDRERRHAISAGEVEYASVALQPAATAMAEVALKDMLVAMPGSRAVLCMIAAWKGTGLEAP